ncbi:HlyD family efflux transporter periplasmic adaptor subunit [Streptococcus oricebi]|uniref:HlyD family efflux transporter periplasmic adaptor subunit n=1 Tax=Streptococcus oricebi TaxID=1547447 RepID=A0ABS5B396_9STRE|nr:HlyD family efflux transporter periplasmic adaptor subunit [Streptococcus oricebi]MBP2623295.1 hypothetical protein [Streptococcus oricebi]
MAKDKLSMTDYISRYSHQKDEQLKYDFMPSLLEIVERPAHSAGKYLVLLISLLVVISLAWAGFSSVDIVVLGSGSILPEKQIQTISSASNGVVKSLKVKEGDQVKEGSPLLELDDTVAKQTVKELEDGLVGLKAAIEVVGKYQADKQATINLADYQEVAHLLIRELLAENTLYRQQLSQADANLVNAQYDSTLAQRLTNLNEKKVKAETELTQQRYLLEHLQITAPTKGTVASLGVNHVGQVIGAGSNLASLVPSGSELIFESQVADKDRADIKVGMKAVVKLQAYPYSDYGTIPAKVTYISPTAFQVKGKGAVYQVRVAVDQSHMHQGIELISGLSGTVEIRTGKRTVLDYFLDPIRDGLDKSLKEK